MNQIYFKILGAIFLIAGVATLVARVMLFIGSDSSLSVVLLALSIISNVAGILLLSYVPSKKKK